MKNKRLNTPKTRPSKAAAAQYAPSRSTGPAVNPLAPGSLPSSAEVVRSLRDHPGNSAARAWQQGSQHESPWVKLEVEQNALKMLKPMTLEDVWHTMLIINWLDDSPLQSRSCVEHLFTAFLYLFLGKWSTNHTVCNISCYLYWLEKHPWRIYCGNTVVYHHTS